MAFNAVVPTSTQPVSQNTSALKQTWKNLQPDSCPLHYNFHLHTVCSDGQLTPQALMGQAVTLGLKGMAVTDHHSIRGYQAAQYWLKDIHTQHPDTPLPHLWTGIEVTSNLQGTEVHILSYAFDPEHSSIQPYLQSEAPRGSEALAVNVISSFHQAGGLVVLAHPARYRRAATELIPVAAHLGIDGVEAYYAYGNPKPWQPSHAETQQITHLSEIYKLFRTCGTDTHGSNIMQRI
jgi:predicted metal-dependent phosphoesterase TrpH